MKLDLCILKNYHPDCGVEVMENVPKKAQVIIVGGGIIGCSVAYHLTKLGCEKPIPHVGWNDTDVKNKSILFKGIESGNDFFYVHSYCFLPSNPSAISSIVNYDAEIVASIEKDNVFGTQFHPEKSSKAGLKLLKNFLDL